MIKNFSYQIPAKIPAVIKRNLASSNSNILGSEKRYGCEATDKLAEEQKGLFEKYFGKKEEQTT